MGMITVTVQGSFGKNNQTRQFSAMKSGHAAAIADAISFLSGELLPDAISLDHQLANEGESPSEGFGRDHVPVVRQTK